MNRDGQHHVKPIRDEYTHSSNSCSMLHSDARRHSGVVTKWIPLFNVHVIIVGSRGMGPCIPFNPRTDKKVGIRFALLGIQDASYL